MSDIDDVFRIFSLILMIAGIYYMYQWAKGGCLVIVCDSYLRDGLMLLGIGIVLRKLTPLGVKK